MENYHVLDLIGEGSFGKVGSQRRGMCSDSALSKLKSAKKPWATN